MHREGCGERETGKGEKPTKDVLVCRQLGPSFLGTPIEHSATKGMF